MLTGEEDKVTLSICITPKTSEPPSSVSDFQRILGNFLSKKLEMGDVRFRKSMIGRTQVDGRSRTVFLQDFDADVAEEILTKMRDVNVAGLTIERCNSLPEAMPQPDRYSSRFDDRSYRGGGGRDRRPSEESFHGSRKVWQSGFNGRR